MMFIMLVKACSCALAGCIHNPRAQVEYGSLWDIEKCLNAIGFVFQETCRAALHELAGRQRVDDVVLESLPA